MSNHPQQPDPTHPPAPIAPGAPGTRAFQGEAFEDENAFMYPLQGFMAWVFPGAGHILHGQRGRGAVLMLTILLLWTWGWLIGGLTSFDRREHPFWFACQAMTAPSFGVSLALDLRQPRDNQGRIKLPIKPPDAPYEPSYGRANELGILFTSLAGLLNLLAIVDAGLNSRRAQPDDAEDIQPDAAKPAATPGVLRWSVLWPRLATAAVLFIGVGLAVPLRLFASSPHESASPGYRPFIDPLPWNDAYWMLTIVPLSLAVSIVYRTVRSDKLSDVPRQAIIFTAQIVGSMALVAAIVWALASWL